MNEEYDWSLQRNVPVSSKQVVVEVAQNGQQYVSNSLQYQYYNSDVQGISVTPKYLPIPGLPTLLTIQGSDLRDTGTLFCRLVRNGRNEVGRSPARYIDNTTATCISPQFTLADWDDMSFALSALKIEISLNGQDFSLPPVTGSASFGFYRRPLVTRLSPLCGFAVGGTVISLGGDFLAQHINPDLPRCRFNRLDSTIVPATKVPGSTDRSTFVYTCVTPNLKFIGDTVVELALNGVTFVELTPEDGVGFYALPQGAISSVSPGSGLFSKQFTVTITGVDFRSPASNIQPQCRFETAASQAGWIYTAATIVDFRTIECLSPQVSAPQPNDGQGRYVAVQVSLNGQNWVSESDMVVNLQPESICYTCNNEGAALRPAFAWLSIIVIMSILLVRL